ncbi:MAG: hypothetical protein M9938_05365 [Solirubrobacterales bacterium]|nr:hypothetical protein [Solirubrobacterales bacterium]
MEHWRELLTRTLPGRLALLLGAVALLGFATAAFGHYVLGAWPSFGEAIWNATAHLIDPGQIGDDTTGPQRTIGVIQVLIGIVFVAGIVLTVLSEVFDRALRRLDRGDPAIRVTGHLLVIGINDTLDEVRQILAAGLEGEHPPIVVMLPPDQSDQRATARRALSGYPGRSHVIEADPRTDGFDRVCAAEARRVVILSPGLGPDRADLTAIGRATRLAGYLKSRDAMEIPVAVELRRGRNVQALWYQGGPPEGTRTRRFPASFDALVNDRTIGTLLSLVVQNPHFSGVFLAGDGALSSPALKDGGQFVGRTFAEVRDRLEGASLIGLLQGAGMSARATYLPPDDQSIQPGDRLILVRDESRGSGVSGEVDPGSIKVAPSRPGPVLILGFSDSAAALLEELERVGFDLTRVGVLLSENRRSSGGNRIPRDVDLIDGDPCQPADIERAVERTEPSTVFVAAEPDRDAEAVISGQLVRQASSAPIVIEQRSASADALDLTPGQVTVASTSNLAAETVALSLTDPALVVARERILTDPGLVFESLVYSGSSPLALGEVPRVFNRAGYYPLAVSVAGDPAGVLAQGDHILAMHRPGR